MIIQFMNFNQNLKRESEREVKNLCEKCMKYFCMKCQYKVSGEESESVIEFFKSRNFVNYSCNTAHFKVMEK